MSYPVEERFYSAPLPRMTILRLAAVPQPTVPVAWGRLRQMASIPFLVNYLDGTKSTDKARFSLAYDGEALFVVGWLGAPTHGRDEIVEDPVRHEQYQLLVNPTPRKVRWYRIRLRPTEAMAIDAGGEDAPPSWWSDEATLVQGPAKDGWEFAVRIPFHLLGARCPEPGDLWRMNMFRMFVKRQEDNSSWSVIGIGRNDIPERYGELVFGGPGPCGWLTSLTIRAGTSRATFSLVGGSSETTCSAESRSDDRRTGFAIVNLPGHRRFSLEHEFPVQDGGRHVIEVRDRTGEVLVRTPVATGLPPIRDRVAHLRRSIRQMPRAPAAAGRAAEQVAGKLERVKQRLEEPTMTAQAWRRIERSLAGVEYRASVLALRMKLRDPSQPAALLAETSLTKVFPGRLLSDDLKQRARLTAPKGGSDSAQVVLLAFDDDLRGCAVQVSPLIGPGGAVLAPDAVEVSLVGSVETRRPRYTVEYVGLHPDPLLPVEPFTVEKGSHATLWLTVAVPEDATAGVYRGRLCVTPQRGHTLFVPITLTVWDFALPSQTTLRTAFPMFEREIEQFYGEPLTRERRWRYYDFLLRRRISPSCQYETEPRPRIEDLDEVMAQGSNVVSMGYLQSDRLDEWVESLRPTVEFLRKRGWTDRAYVYGFDEIIPGDGYPRLIEAYGRLKEHYRDLPRACTIGPSHDLPKLYGTVDIWIPQTDRFDPPYRDRQKVGDEVWCYVSMWPRRPFANLFIDYEAIEHRIIFWQLWKHGVTGFLYYCINLWSSNTVGEPNVEREVAALPNRRDRVAIERGARWPEVPWNTFTGPTAVNGDGQLIYPGPDGGPLSSVRLECVRHGIEDYELLATLQEEVRRQERSSSPEVKSLVREARKLLHVPVEVCSDFRHFTHDPRTLLRTRRAIGDLIERMRHADET